VAEFEENEERVRGMVREMLPIEVKEVATKSQIARINL
jgi:hypothetical protein